MSVIGDFFLFFSFLPRILLFFLSRARQTGVSLLRLLV